MSAENLSPEQLRANVRVLDRALIAFSLAMFAMMASPFASLGRAMAFEHGARGPVHDGSGMAAWTPAARPSPARLSLTMAGTSVDLGCPGHVFARAADLCPPFSDNWNGRELTVRWLDMPTGLLGEPVHRAIDVHHGGEVLFQASIEAVARNEVASAFQRMLVPCAVFLPIIGLFSLLRPVLRRRAAAAEAAETQRRDWLAARSAAGRRSRGA